MPAKRVPGTSHASYRGMQRRYTITQLNMRRCAPEIDDLSLWGWRHSCNDTVQPNAASTENSVLTEVNCQEFRCSRRNEIVKKLWQVARLCNSQPGGA